MKILFFFIGFTLSVMPVTLYNYYLDHFGYVRDITSNQFYSINAPYDWAYRSSIASVKNAAWHIKHAKKDPTLLMGSSRSSGFYGPKFSSQLNTSLVKLDLPGSTLAEHRYNLEGILQEGARPKRVIIALDDFDLYYKEGYSKRLLFPTTFFSKFRFFIEWLFRIPSYQEATSLLNHQGVYQRVGFGELFEPVKIPDFISITQGLDVPAMEASQFSPELYEFFIEENLRFASDIIELSNEYNFEVTLLFTPRWVKAYYRRDHQSIFEFKRQLSELHSFYDFSGVGKYTVDSSYWTDSSHFDTNLGVYAGDVIMNGQDEELIFGRLVTSDNILQHLGELKNNLITNFRPMLNRYPDIIISQVLENFIKPFYIRVNLPLGYVIENAINSEYSIPSYALENSEFITLKFNLTDYNMPSDPKKTMAKTIFWNDEHLGKVKFGVGHRYSLTKQWAINSEKYSADKNNILAFKGSNGRLEIESAYLTIDILKLQNSKNKKTLYSDGVKSIYQVNNILLFKFNNCIQSESTFLDLVSNDFLSNAQLDSVKVNKSLFSEVDTYTLNNVCYGVHFISNETNSDVVQLSE